MNTKRMAAVAMIAAIYTAISLALAPFSFGNIQVRIAEALTLLPLLNKDGIYGITLGCFLTNLIGAMMGVNPTGVIDAVVGTSATLMAGICTYKLRNVTVKGIPFWAIMMPVIFNAVIVGLELAVLYFPETIVTGTLICGAEVGIGELISVVIGWFVIRELDKRDIFKEK